MQNGNRVPIDQQFFSEKNEQSLFGALKNDIEARQDARLTKIQTNRLAKTLEHYMQEVWDVNGPLPLTQLNGEVAKAVTRDFSGYLRRDVAVPTLAMSERIVTDPTNQPRAEVAQQRLLQQQGLPVQPRPTFESNLLMDTGSRFETMQQERMPPAPAKQSIPDFQVSLTANGDEPSALSLYEQAKKMRDAEVAKQQADVQRVAGIQSATGPAVTDANPLVRFMSPPSIQNDAQNNPTLAQPIAAIITPQPRGPLPQDFLIKQDDIINYKETEYNLILYSADRDWLNNTRENRYNFSVIFDPGNNKQGFTLQPSTNKKFKNISRIELVKAILPSEGLETLVNSEKSDPPAPFTYTYSSPSKINVLSYPYVLVRIPELDTNNYGTDNNIDNSFAVLQYDANWYTDTTNVSDGYLGMIPKFMKCQKVYQPTPLATLTKLTIELQTPNGSPLSTTSDTLTIQNIYTSTGNLAGIYTGNYAGATDGTNGVYYIIRTTTFFNKWLFQPGNRIQIKGLNPSQINGGATLAGQQFIDYLQSDNGLLIVGIANTTNTIDGTNDVGYANLIIVRALMDDPTTGSENAFVLGTPSYSNSDLTTSLNLTTFTGAKLINLTHQTNVVLRIITRDMDAAARVRPDNL